MYILSNGIPSSVIFKAMTIDAARLLGVDKDRASLRVGLAADIIDTVENPFEKANALKRASFVMKNGVVIKRE
jgi:imidazolonepropionase-like amidohydrolase